MELCEFREFRELRRILAITVSALVLSACSGQDSPVPAGADVASPTGDSSTAPSPPATAAWHSGEAAGRSGPEQAPSTEQAAPATPDPVVVTEFPAPRVPVDDVRASTDGKRFIDPFVQVGAKALGGEVDNYMSTLATLTDGPALDEVRGLVEEFEANGWTQTGAPVVRSATVVSVDQEGEPPSVVLEVCLDHSSVTITDVAGTSQVDPAAPKRALNLFTLHLVEGSWMVHERTFPVDTEC